MVLLKLPENIWQKSGFFSWRDEWSVRVRRLPGSFMGFLVIGSSVDTTEEDMMEQESSSSSSSSSSSLSSFAEAALATTTLLEIHEITKTEALLDKE